MKMKLLSYMTLFLLAGTALSTGHTADAAESKATSVPLRIYVNNAYELTEAYKLNSEAEYYYKIQDIAASVRDLSIRFVYEMNGTALSITTHEDYQLTGTEYAAADLLTCSAKTGGRIMINGTASDVTGYIINGDYCISMKQAAKIFDCAFYALGRGKGADNQLMTSYKYDPKGKRLERKLSEITANTSNFNRMWEGFAASYEGNIYFLGNQGLTKMNNEGTKSQVLVSGTTVNINIANDLLYYSTGAGDIFKMNLDGSENVKIQQYAHVGAEHVVSMLVIDDSVFYIYNNGKTNNIDTFDMVGRDMIVDSWMRQTLYTQGVEFYGEHRIDNFYYDRGYIYFCARWIIRIKLNDYNTPTGSEVVAEGESYQQQKLDDNNYILMGKNPGDSEFYKYYNRHYGYVYKLTTENKAYKIMPEQIYIFTVAFNKLLYTDAQKALNSRDITDSKGTTKTKIKVPGISKVMRYNIAGDWIICKSEADLNSKSNETVLIKLDGTTPTAEY